MKKIFFFVIMFIAGLLGTYWVKGQQEFKQELLVSILFNIIGAAFITAVVFLTQKRLLKRKQ